MILFPGNAAFPYNGFSFFDRGPVKNFGNDCTELLSRAIKLSLFCQAKCKVINRLATGYACTVLLQINRAI